jgi:hypothetical protein
MAQSSLVGSSVAPIFRCFKEFLGFLGNWSTVLEDLCQLNGKVFGAVFKSFGAKSDRNGLRATAQEHWLAEKVKN